MVCEVGLGVGVLGESGSDDRDETEVSSSKLSTNLLSGLRLDD